MFSEKAFSKVGGHELLGACTQQTQASLIGPCGPPPSPPTVPVGLGGFAGQVEWVRTGMVSMQYWRVAWRWPVP